MDLKEVLEQMMKRYQLDKPTRRMDAQALWQEVAGPLIAKYTTQVYLKNQILTVHLSSAPLKQELNLRKADMIARMNQAAGTTLITDCYFR